MNRKTLPVYIDNLQTSGQYFFIRDQAMETCNLTKVGFKSSVDRLLKKRRIARVRGDFFIIIPLEYQVSGVLPGSWFIDDYMRFRGRPYYVGLLSAASIHGAAHQQPQEFQVITDKPDRNINIRGLHIRFFMKSQIHDSYCESVKTETGYIRISNAAMTAIDLIRYENRIGGLNRAASIIQELSEVLDDASLLRAAQSEKTFTHIQRLGYVMELMGRTDLVTELSRWLRKCNPRITALKPGLPMTGFPCNKHWNIVVNADVEWYE